MSLSFEMPYATLLQYSPRLRTSVAKRSQRAKDLFKSGRVKHAKTRFCDVFHESSLLGSFFPEHCALVPVPSSRPFRDVDSLWPSKIICNLLLDCGLSGTTRELLQRTKSMRKASEFFRSQDRPAIEDHLNSLEVTGLPVQASSIVLVDDVLTQGRTASACFIKLHEAYPEIDIKFFAVLRTRSFLAEDEFLEIVHPHRGMIRYSHPSVSPQLD